MFLEAAIKGRVTSAAENEVTPALLLTLTQREWEEGRQEAGGCHRLRDRLKQVFSGACVRCCMRLYAQELTGIAVF